MCFCCFLFSFSILFNLNNWMLTFHESESLRAIHHTTFWITEKNGTKRARCSSMTWERLIWMVISLSAYFQFFVLFFFLSLHRTNNCDTLEFSSMKTNGWLIALNRQKPRLRFVRWFVCIGLLFHFYSLFFPLQMKCRWRKVCRWSNDLKNE